VDNAGVPPGAPGKPNRRMPAARRLILASVCQHPVRPFYPCSACNIASRPALS
jgi:hypothetical protein